MLVKLSPVAAAVWLLTSGCGEAQPMKLIFPVQCDLGQDCLIQNYVDADPKPGAAVDYRGGSLSYDDHNGVDIRLPTMVDQKRGVDVLAAADGRVLRVRDGVDDLSVRARGREAVASTECGNGLVIEHAGGLQTQYCHMAEGSLRVKPGDTVAAGTPLGRIGLSGLTEYPHLHFVVRRGETVVDPFAEALWRSPAAYSERAVLNVGFQDRGATSEGVEAGDLLAPVSGASPALVAVVRAVGLKQGDVQELTLFAPGGTVLSANTSAPLDRNKAQNLLFAGKKRPPAGWAAGTYRARYTVRNNGAVVLTREFDTRI